MDLDALLRATAPAFAYADGQLSADGVTLSDIADAAGGPVYAYALDAIVESFQAFQTGFEGQPTRICYAMKANDSIAVLKALVNAGAGLDVVSGGELALGLAAGAPADTIVFSGVGKTDAELTQAVDVGVMQINVETEAELRRLSAIAAAKGRQAPVAIRVNPDVEAGTLDQISTGRAQDKFGIAYERAPALYAEAAGLPGIAPVGVAMHIGSQIGDVAFLAEACGRLRKLWEALAADGVKLSRFDIGGGLGVRYRDETPPDLAAYADVVKQAVRGLDCEVVLEPGRRIVGPAGVLLATVVAIKDTADRRFVILDAAMNDLIRPALYKAWHTVVPLQRPAPNAEWQPADIVGPVCESTDKFAEARSLPPLVAGDRVAFLTAGAYGAVLASEYNGRPRAPEAVMRGGQWSFSRPPRTHDDLIREQKLPTWL